MPKKKSAEISKSPAKSRKSKKNADSEKLDKLKKDVETATTATTSGAVNNTNSNKIKLINNYIQNTLNNLPQASILANYSTDNLFYTSFSDDNQGLEEKHEEKSSTPIVISNHFFNDFPIHKNIFIKCCFCETLLNPALKDFNIFEQPQSRRRFTPYCLDCANKNCENISFI